MNLKESLETIKDSRIDRCKKHSLVDILMIVFFGLLCGYKSIESIHLYAELLASGENNLHESGEINQKKSKEKSHYQF